MTRYNLAVSYFLKDKLREKFKISWDGLRKNWYFETDGELPEGLLKYQETEVDISYKDRNEYKAQFNSLRFDRDLKSWVCSLEDFEKIQKYREEQLDE